MGKKSLEQLVIEKAGHLCSDFSSEKGHPFDPHYLINNAVSSVIYFLMFGNYFDYKDQRHKRLLHLLEKALKEEAGFLPQFLQVVPFLLFIPGVVQKVFQHQKGLFRYLEELVKEHKETRNHSCRGDITDAFLEEMEKRKDDINSSFNERNLSLVIADLLGAGTETTNTTLRWGLLHMILYPSVQSKVQEEIVRLLARTGHPKWRTRQTCLIHVL